MMENLEERDVWDSFENALLQLLKKYPLFEFARRKKSKLGYEITDITLTVTV